MAHGKISQAGAIGVKPASLRVEARQMQVAQVRAMPPAGAS